MGEFLPSSGTRLGNIEIETIYDYYDAPVLFSARDDLGHAYLAYFADVSDAGSTYLYVPISDLRLRRVTTGRIPLRDAYAGAERGTVFTVTIPSTADPVPPTVEQMASADIPADWLPDADVLMAAPPESSLEPFSPDELLASARRQRKHLVALELSPAQESGRPEAKLRDAGPLMVQFQGMADTMSANADFAFEGIQAASMVIILAPAVGEGMFPLAPPALLEDLRRLFESVASPDFADYLSRTSRRTRAHIRDFLEVPSDAGAGLDLFIAPPVGTMHRNSLSLEQIRGGLRLMRETKVLPDNTLNFEGHLESINHPNRRFGVRELPPPGKPRARGKGYTGKFDPEVSIEGLSSGLTILYRFSLIQEPEEDELGQLSYKNRITALERITAEPQS